MWASAWVRISPLATPPLQIQLDSVASPPVMIGLRCRQLLILVPHLDVGLPAGLDVWVVPSDTDGECQNHGQAVVDV